MSLPDAFAPLMAYRRWVTWDSYPDPDRPGKTIKRPTDVRTGLWCNSNDPDHQYGYDEAAATGRKVGFVFNKEDGFWFLDIDGALEAGPGGMGYQWSGLATMLCEQLAGVAIEVSQSGTGLHLVGRGVVPDHSCKNILAHLELYTHERFVALTGNHARGYAGHDASAAITGIAERFFPPSIHGDIAGWTDTPAEGYGGPTDDDELIRAALASGKKSAAAAFGGTHVTFEDLWTANEDALTRKWPSDKGGYDASQADGALASHLAYWTGKDCERIRALMLRSALARPKWDDRPEWLDTTILKASAVVTNIATGKPPPDVPDQLTATGLALRKPGQEYLSSADQLAFFTGCVYIVAEHKIWIPATGDTLDKARFDVVYAGHVFPLDGQNDKVTDSAWDAFTRSRVFQAPRVDHACFRPEEPAGGIVHEDGRTMVNTYIPIATKRLAGDPSPFLNHLAKMLPDERDRTILLHYMASMRQNPGHKFQWWPVIQGVEGNGKTMIDRIMSFAIGQRYSHLVNPEAMAKTGNQFNTWVQGNLYLGIEEIYVNNRRDFLDSFKATVTNERTPMEGKGTNQTTGDNRINGVMFTNHHDAVPINIDSRRYCIFFTAQQSLQHLHRDGMLGGYFPDLYDWLYGRNQYGNYGPNYGLQVVNNYLAEYQLQAELDPARLCVRAPETTSTQSALRFSLGRAELEILEAIEEGRPGFCGGWVSSIMMDRLLDQLRVAVPRTKRRELMQSLGYDFHRGLNDGRVNNPVMPDNAKPRLFVTKGHLSLELRDQLAIAKAYSVAQDTTSNAVAAARFGANNN